MTSKLHLKAAAINELKAKDFTPERAVAWVVQEAAKHVTPESRAARVAGERRFLRLAAEAGLDRVMPNAVAAYAQLIERLLHVDAAANREIGAAATNAFTEKFNAKRRRI